MVNLVTRKQGLKVAGKMMTMKAKIERIWFEVVTDTDADTSWIGKYTNDANPEAFIRYGEHSGKQVKELGEDDELPNKGREYRFFLPAMTGEETGNPESPKQDYARMEALNDGQWRFIGIIAKAEIRSENGILQTLRSGGLWGIESDSGAPHLETVKQDELAQLTDELTSLGFGKRAIALAGKRAETVNK